MPSNKDQQNDEIRNVLGQLQRQARDVNKSLAKNQALLALKNREVKQITLTLSELDRLSSQKQNYKLWQPIGKMFIYQPTENVVEDLKKTKTSAEQESVKLSSKIKSLNAEVETNQVALTELIRSMDL